MYPKFFDKIAFSKDHKNLLIQLYDKKITRREYDRTLNKLYLKQPPQGNSEANSNKG